MTELLYRIASDCVGEPNNVAMQWITCSISLCETFGTVETCFFIFFSFTTKNYIHQAFVLTVHNLVFDFNVKKLFTDKLFSFCYNCGNN